MRWQTGLSILACAALLFTAGCGPKETTAPANNSGAYLTLTDAANRKVVLTKQPQRVVALSPSLLEMVDAVGGKLVGRASSKNGTIPASMKNVPEVGLVYNINMENLVGLKPDLVLASRNQHDKFIPLMESNKIQAIEFNVRTYKEVLATVKTLGQVFHTEAKAQAVCDKIEKETRAKLSKIPKDAKQKRIVIMHATANSVTVEGPNSIAGCISDMIGFDNVAGKALKGKGDKTPYSMEALVEQDPDIIFVTSMGKPEAVQNRLRTDFQNNPAWQALRAVKENKIYVLPESLFLLNPGLRYPAAVEYMAKTVYPEAFK